MVLFNDVKADQIMHAAPVALSADEHCGPARAALQRAGADDAPVLDRDGRLVGWLRRDDLSDPGDGALAARLRPSAVAVRPETMIQQVCATLARPGIERLVVVRGEAVQGLIGPDDVLGLVAARL